MQRSENSVRGRKSFHLADASTWATRITERWHASVQAIIEVGVLLISAKAALPHGDFGAMIETSLPFSASTAQRLMAIASDARLSNAAHVQHLPASWGTLYELTKLSDEEFDQAIGKQIIRPDMERWEIAERIRPPLTEQLPERSKDISEMLPRTADGKFSPEIRKALAPVIKELRAEKQREKGERRDAREADLGRKLRAMAEKHFGVVLEDFEWDHEPWSRETGMDRHPSNHYPTSIDAHTPEEIVARTAERFKCAADICVLYTWTTIPHAAIAMRVLELRGFTYKSQRVWDKVRPGAGRGPGYWVTGEHEILLIGTRGDVIAPTNAHFPSRFEAPVGEHSEKPDQQYEHAEFHFPNLPKIELNARRFRSGWQQWGYEAPTEPTPGDEAAPMIDAIVSDQILLERLA
jgi:N6-adenosine-specific RNA methylase IME4